MDKSNRFETIDICKAIAIVLVAWGHFGMPGFIDRFVHLFMLPVFYFSSGLFFRPEKYSSPLFFLKKRAKSLLIPYFSLGILIYLIWTLVYLIFLPDKVTGPLEYSKHLFWNNTGSVTGIWGGIQWFLTSLFFAELLVFLVNKLIRNKYLLLLFFTVLGVAIILLANSISGSRIPMAFDTALVVPVFYCVGYLVADKIRDWLEKARTSWLILGFVLTFAGTFLFCRLNVSTNIRKLVFGNPLYYYLGALFGVMMTVCLAELIRRLLGRKEKLLRWVCYIGSSTIIILYLHRQFDGINKTLLESVFHVTLSGAKEYIYFGVSLIVFFIIASPVCRWINKYLGFLFGKF